MRHRVVVTGLGALCSAGDNRDSFCKSVAEGRAAFSPIARNHLAHLRATHAGLIAEFDATRFVPNGPARRLDRFVHLAAAAGKEALEHARIRAADCGSAIGLIFGTCSGPMQTIERHYANILAGDPYLTKEELFAHRYYSGARALAHVFGICGPSATVVTACSAGAAAIGFAADLIRLGIVDVALAGGSDAFSETTLAGFDGLKATCEGTCAPFSKPIGLNLGEGAAFCVLENMDRALSRGAAMHAEILGFGLSNDAYHATSPDPSGSGQALAMERALSDAGMLPTSICYVNAHGTGTEANDKAETKALRRVLGERCESVPVSSTKSIIGHCLGAAGALETVASIMCISKGIVPPTAHFSERRDGCTLDYVPDSGRTISKNGAILKNNFAFGGNNASLVINGVPDPVNAAPERGSGEQVAITGIGIVSPAGIGPAALRAAADSSSGEFQEISLPGGAIVCVARVPAFDMASVDRRIDIRNMDRSSFLATAAARLALADSLSSEHAGRRSEIGLYCHVSAGPSWAESEHISSLLRNNFRISQVAAFPYIVPNSVTGNVCKALRISGHNTTFCLGPGAGLMGLGHAVCAIQNGHSKFIVSLSVDELSDRILLDSLSAGLISKDTVPPAEAACAFVLESLASARARSATILGTVCSTAYSTETDECFLPSDNTATLADTIRRALDQAEISADHVGLICHNAENGREALSLRAIVGNRKVPTLDLSPKLGCAEASAPMLTLAYALQNSFLQDPQSKEYILLVFASSHGVNCVTVIHKGNPKEIVS